MNNRSYISNATSHDNTFNFGNQLDISNGKKDKTGQMFFRQVYDFQDFQNIADDKTVKISNYKLKKDISSIMKRSVDQNSGIHQGNSIIDNEEGMSFVNKPVVSASMRKIYYQNDKYPPKFGDRKDSSDSQKPQVTQLASNNFQQDCILKKEAFEMVLKQNLNQKINQFTSIKTKQGKKQSLILAHYNPDQMYEQNQVKKQSSAQSLQQQYKQLLSTINYLKQQTQKTCYQRLRLQQESTLQLKSLTNSQSIQEQMKNYLQGISLLNLAIQKERAVQRRMTNAVAQLNDEYNLIVQSIQHMDFKRPPIIRDDYKIIIDQINLLKAQFQSLQRDHGSLNLSCTLAANMPSSNENRYVSNRQLQTNNPTNDINPKQIFLKKLLQEIHTEHLRSQDPHFLKNLKLACIKQQWTIFTNKQLQISVDYKTSPFIKLRIGNKTNQLLTKFTVQLEIDQVKENILQNEVLNKKSFLLQGVKISPQILEQMFIRVCISYNINNQQNDANKSNKQIKLFIPTGLLNFGQFSPLTLKQYQMQSLQAISFIQSSYRPIDKNIIAELDQALLYFPNLQVGEAKLFGLFMGMTGKGTLIQVKQRDHFVKVRLGNGRYGLLGVLQFFFTV